MPAHPLFTIGHSSVPIERLLALLAQHQIEVVADVRTSPYSAYAPQFNQAALQQALVNAGLRYVHLDGLGGRPSDPDCYDEDSHVRYDRVARSGPFRADFTRLTQGVDRFRVAILCSEEDPTGCHRRLLVARVAAEAGLVVQHIRGDGRLETEADLTNREQAGQLGLFGTPEPAWRSVRPIPRPAAHPSR